MAARVRRKQLSTMMVVGNRETAGNAMPAGANASRSGWTVTGRTETTTIPQAIRITRRVEREQFRVVL